MKPETRSRFVAFTAKFEGCVSWMYLDVLALCTTAIGNLIDPIDAALALPWKRPDGTDATPSEVAYEWHIVKNRDDMKLHGGGAYAKITKLRLTEDGILLTVTKRLNQMDSALAKRYAGWEELPWQAQLAVLSMAWAAGPAFKAPKFDAAMKARDWKTCAVESHLNDTHNPGLRPRNDANRKLFEEAAALAVPPSFESGPAGDEVCGPTGHSARLHG